MSTMTIKSGGRLMKRVGIVAALHAALVMPVQAQRRTINDGTPGQLLRTWPQAGVWQVVLGIGKDRELACAMLTGQEDASSGELYTWGFRQKGANVWLMVIDKNRRAIAGDTIKVVIDTAPVDVFKIGERMDESGMHNVRAEIPTRTVRELIALAPSSLISLPSR